MPAVNDALSSERAMDAPRYPASLGFGRQGEILGFCVNGISGVLARRENALLGDRIRWVVTRLARKPRCTRHGNLILAEAKTCGVR